MDTNPFIEKYNSKSNSELKSIASSKDTYQLDARVAAIYILKNRGDKSDYDKSALEELRVRQDLTNREKIAKENQTTKIIQRLSLIPSGRDSCWSLSNWRQLEIKKINNNLFRARIEDNYRSYLAPVILCQIKTESTLAFYPFFYIKPLLYSLIISVLIFAIHTLGIVKIDSYIFATILPVALALVLQLMTAPLLFFVIKEEVINKLGR